MTSSHWTRSARCRNSSNPDLWYPATYGGGITNLQLCAARAECLACPVRRECLAEALEDEKGKPRDSRHGVRACTTPTQRWRLDKTAQQPRCGTVAGFRSHTANNTTPCTACQTAEDERIERLKAATTGATCGTPGGYKRHIAVREKTCDACKAAYSEHRRLERHAAPAA